MQSEKNETKVKPESRPKPKKKGISVSLVIILVLLALLCGAALGYLCCRYLSPMAKEYARMREQIQEYELQMANFYTDEFSAETLGDITLDEDGNDELSAFLKNPEAEAEIVVAAEYDGGQIMSDEALSAYEKILSDQMMNGLDVSQSSDMILDVVLQSLVSDRIAYNKAEEMGCTNYSAADQAEIVRRAEEQYEEKVSFYGDFLRTEGMSDEDARTEAVTYLELMEECTPESVKAEVEKEFWKEKLFDRVVEGVTVSKDDVTLLYADMVSAQKEIFEADPEAFEETVFSGSMVVYHPAGYRAVKQIFLMPDNESALRMQEIRALLLTETDEAVIAQLNGELDGLYAPLEEKAAEIMAKLNDGSDFDALMAEYSDDEELTGGLFAPTGYYVSQNSTLWPEEFVRASMSLANPGDISEPVRSENGVHIVRYISNLDPGEVPMSKVEQELTDLTLESRKFEVYQEQLQTWLDEANVVMYPERLYVGD